MAGIEQLEVHSKSYIVRWVQVDEGDTLSWSVQPHKKSINFGIVKHPGSGATSLISATPPTPGTNEVDASQFSEAKGSSRFPKKDSSAQELLANKGFIPIKWVGKCEADKVSIGSHDVTEGQSGMYGLVFDNTFSKQTSKTATFVVLTYPTGAAPHGPNHLPNLQIPNARGSQTSLGKYAAGRLDGNANNSSDSLHSQPAGARNNSISGRSEGSAGNYHVGTLSKRRRKKGQGYARRFFSLDYSTCTLSYYYNRNSSALRGAIPLSLAAVAADERRREISIDSGAEVWHLRAPNDKEFQEWARALEKASRVARGLETVQQPAKPALRVDTRHLKPHHQSNHDEDAEWQQIETLVSRVVGTRDALRRLTKDIAVHRPVTGNSASVSANGQFLSPSAGGAEENRDSYFTPPDKKPFWRRKSSASVLTPSALHQSTTPTSPKPEDDALHVPKHAKRRSKCVNQEEKSVQDHCQALLSDLDSVVSEFTELINASKRRRIPIPRSAGGAPRRSMDTTASSVDEFFDAEDVNPRVVQIDGSDDEFHASDEEDGSFPDSSSVSSFGEDEPISADDIAALYPTKPKSLAPLPIDTAVTRRRAIPPSPGPPPSLIALVRKNVGKDLSTISMPVSTNEPTSMLQMVAEQLEYAQLLDKAVQQKTTLDRLLYVTAFALSFFSSSRAKERAVRKPFTPLLGETFELIRTNKEVPGGFRLLVEKVQHRPLKLAIQADSASWSLAQCACPGQKFWGKSAEITTEGRVRVVLRLPDGSDELYSWNIATMFLRNVVMGEKYMEPVGSMTILNDSTGHKATAEFKSKGMFGARVEEVQVDTYNPDGSSAGAHLNGNWMTSLRRGNNPKSPGEEIWHAAPLPNNAAQAYGLTAFAASLNEITAIEKDKMAPTDCRLRPDQRMTEEGNLDGAEEWKTKLEEAQRVRRRELEDKGEEYKPKWFVKVHTGGEGTAAEGEDVWKIKGGKESYWEERQKGNWEGCLNLFNV
ncbi:hypothetical protein NLU13_5585 [Sarocladium strictum]|uniref:PH domain-containing protein n=1 Tax=Sarocladium strictum TaxID=5046 RepID=A0AA39L7S6_SARSR|nr:hypothetical protein NLU13_5585 [Sarocladium strictum]